MIRIHVKSVQTNSVGPNIIIYCHNFIQGYDISTLNQFLNMATLIRLTICTYNDHLDDFGITIHEGMCFSHNSSVFSTSRRLHSRKTRYTYHVFVIIVMTNLIT